MASGSTDPVAVVAVFIGFPVGAAIAYTLGKVGGPNSTVALIAQRQHIAHHGVTTAAYREVLGNPHVQTLLSQVLLGPVRSLPAAERQVTLPDGDQLVLHETWPTRWRPSL